VSHQLQHTDRSEPHCRITAAAIRFACGAVFGSNAPGLAASRRDSDVSPARRSPAAQMLSRILDQI